MTGRAALLISCLAACVWLASGCVALPQGMPDGDAPVVSISGVVNLRPSDIDWDTVPTTPNGRQRFVLWGNPDAGGAWVYRVRVRARLDVAPHTHPVDEYITVVEGDWAIGFGQSFDRKAMRTFPPGSFVRIPAGVPHFIAIGDDGAIIQGAGEGRFTTIPVDVSPAANQSP